MSDFSVKLKSQTGVYYENSKLIACREIYTPRLSFLQSVFPSGAQHLTFIPSSTGNWLYPYEWGDEAIDINEWYEETMPAIPYVWSNEVLSGRRYQLPMTWAGNSFTIPEPEVVSSAIATLTSYISSYSNTMFTAVTHQSTIEPGDDIDVNIVTTTPTKSLDHDSLIEAATTYEEEDTIITLKSQWKAAVKYSGTSYVSKLLIRGYPQTGGTYKLQSTLTSESFPEATWYGY